jgi:hypothetical protein
VHDRERAQDDDRQAGDRDQRVAPVAEERQHDQRRQHRAEHERELYVVDGFLRELRQVGGHRDADVGQLLADAVQLALDAVGDLNAVRARLLLDRRDDRLVAVQAPEAALLGEPLGDSRDLAQPRRAAAGDRDGHVGDLVQRAELTSGLDQLLARALGDAPAGHVQVLAAQRLDDLCRRDAERL